MKAYFDNSATTKPCPEAVKAATDALTDCWGNPSSLHEPGTISHSLLTDSRKKVASAIGCRPESFYFAPSGTVANNTVIFGVADRLKKEGNRIVTTAVEHPSVLNPLKRLEEQGFEIIRLMPDSMGRISADSIYDAVNDKTILVSVMAVNNEVGAVNPVSEIKGIVRAAHAPALIHSDCVQAFGKIDISPAKLGVDFLTVSGHKIHAPKGVGGLYAASLNKLKPYILGGGQENAVFSGTEPMPAIAGFAAAAKALGDIKESCKRVSELKSRFLNAVKDNKYIRINSPDDSIPYIVNISVTGLPSQPIVNFLSENGVYVSAGSACSAGHRSHVLTAMGLQNAVIDSAVRISLSRFTTEEEIDYLAEKVILLSEKYGR